MHMMGLVSANQKSVNVNDELGNAYEALSIINDGLRNVYDEFS